ncbi:MAG TPA: YfiR family protein [Stellaceae bacterium]|nr:YfiR family protein [Stellaceae bacterium]
MAWRAPALAALRLAIALFPVEMPAEADTNSVETAIKATYLYKFAPYVAWPGGVLGPPPSALPLCVVGDDPFGSVLDDAVAGQMVNGHPFLVRRMAVATPQAGCDIMFVAGSAQQSVAAALAATRGLPVLTITDAQQYGGPSGIINFIVVDNRVRFEIDPAAASAHGLAISSKLLSLAVNAAMYK